jgi:hypothetical protein
MRAHGVSVEALERGLRLRQDFAVDVEHSLERRLDSRVGSVRGHPPRSSAQLHGNAHP